MDVRKNDARMHGSGLKLPVTACELKKLFYVYIGEEPHMEFMVAVANLMNMAYKKGKEDRHST